MLKINPYFTILSIICSTLLLNQSFATCHGHFLNNSTQPWIISFDNKASDDGEGNVYFRLKPGQLCDKSHIKNGPCTILPGEELEVDYTDNKLNIAGNIHLTDYMGIVKSWRYNNGAQNFDQCMLIQDNDNNDQGPVTLNTPSTGGALFKDSEWN